MADRPSPPHSNRPGRATRADVARRAGVSPTAVTAVLSGGYATVSVSDATRQRILEAARELNYKPSVQARGLKEQRSMLIAFLCREVYRRSHEIMVGMQGPLEATEYSIMHYSRGDTLDAEARHLELCWERGVDGIALTPMLTPDGRTNVRQVLQIMQQGVPLVQLPNDRLPEVHSVTIDLHAAGALAADHLIELGHQQIAHLIPDAYEDPKDAGQRSHPRRFVHGFEQRMHKAGLNTQYVHYPHGLAIWRQLDSLMAHRHELAERLLSQSPRPTAVCTQNDYLALVLLRALQEKRIAVPDDISVMGTHNIRSTALTMPALTSIELHHDTLGERAAHMILSQIKGEAVTSQQVRPTLMPRETTAPPRA